MSDVIPTLATKNFSIRELSRLCGVKAHTIRMWEIRYGVVRPKRSSGNARHYSIEELEKVLLLCLLSQSGPRISTLSKLSLADLHQRAAGLKSETDRQQKAIQCLILSMYRIETESFEAVLNDCFLSWPVSTVVKEIIFPFLQKVELLHKGKRTNAEHLVVTAIRQKIHWGLERIDVAANEGKTVCLFLPKDTQLDLLLLYLCFVLKEAGQRVLYLGADVSVKNLEDIFTGKKAGHLLTYLPDKHSFPLPHLSAVMDRVSPEAKLIVVTVKSSRKRPVAASNILQLHLEDAVEFLTASEKQN